MSELLKKYESIDQSKLNEATVKILNRVKTITADFTADDEKNNKIAEQVLNEVMKKNPDSVKIVKRTPKAKVTPKKIHKATHTPKVKQTTSSTAKSSNNIMSVAKEIQKAGESWKEAMERAKQVLKERKEQVVQKQKTELEKLFALVKTKKELQGFANSDIQRDSVRDAKPRGARVVTKQGSTSNQYGTFSNKLGRKYWETRDRHADRLAPNYPKDMPLLADGGSVGKKHLVGEFNEQQLRKGEDKIAIEKAQKETGLTYIQSKMIKKSGKPFMQVYLVSNEDYYNSNEFANGGSVNMDKHIWEGWTVGDFIEELEPTFNQIMRGSSWQKPFKTKDEVKAWAMDNQPYYKKNIPEVVNYFWAKVQSKDNYADGGMTNLTMQNVSFADGGSVSNERMYNFLQDDLQKLEEAIKIGDMEEVNKFFTYWLGSSGHLKSLETKTNERMYNFLKEDLEKLEVAVENNDTEEVERFFSYWGQHLESLKMANGGSLPFMTDPNFGNFQNTGAFANGGSIGDLTEQEFLKKYFGASVFTENPSQFFEIKKLSSSDDAKVSAFVKELKADGFTVKKRAFSDFTSVMGVKKKGSFELGGAFMMTDLAGHTGGSDGVGSPKPLSGVSGTYYTGLVGETGAMSSGELFMDGGAMAQNQQVINDASQSYVNYYLGEGASQGIYKDGGSIPNNYEGKYYGDIWDKEWTDKQKYHFLSDHKNEIGFDEEMYNESSIKRATKRMKSSQGNDSGFQLIDSEKLVKTKSSELPRYVKLAFQKHTREGQYASGGSLGEELMGGQSNATLKPSGYHLVSAKGREIIVSDDGGNSKERWVKNNGFSGYRLVYKGNDYEFTDSFEGGGMFDPNVSDGTQFMSGAYAYGGRTKSTPSMRKLYIEQIAFATNTRAVGVDAFAKEHNLTDSELSNLMTGIGRKMISQSDFVTALVGNKNNPKQKEVIAFAKSDKAYKMADGGDVLPPSKTYGENIYKAMQKFNISDSEARKKYGQYTISEWENLLSEKMTDGGAINGSLNKKIQKLAEKKGLTMDALGRDEFNKIMTQALVESLTDANFHEEAKEVVVKAEGKTKWSDELYEAESFNPDEEVSSFAREVARNCEWGGDDILNAYFFITKMQGSKVATMIDNLFFNKKSKSTTSSKPTKYIDNDDIESVTLNVNGNFITFAGKDFLNGANLMEKGGDLSKIATYFPIRDVVKVTLKNGDTIKPLNGYWLKKGSEPMGKKNTTPKIDESKAHFQADALGNVFVDSNFVNQSQNNLPNSELKHYGYGDFYLQTPDGNIDFIRTSEEKEGFVGRTHKMKGSDELVLKLVNAMKEKGRFESTQTFADGGFMNNVYADGGSMSEDISECKKLVSAFCKEFGDKFGLNEEEILEKVKFRDYLGNGATVFVGLSVTSNVEDLKVGETRPTGGYIIFTSDINPSGVTGKDDIARTYSIDIEIKGIKRYTQRRTDEGRYFKSYNYGRTIEEAMDKTDTKIIYDLYPLEKKDDLKFKMSNLFANGGEMESTDISAELEDFDLDNLDPFETMQYENFSKSMGKVGALQVLINSVEGDYSQLSPELAELAEKQMSTEEWDEHSREMYGYAKGGMMAKGGMVVYLDGEKSKSFKTKKSLYEFVKSQTGTGVKKVEIDYGNRIIPTFDTYVIEDGKLIHKGELIQKNYDKEEAEKRRIETQRSLNQMMGYAHGGSTDSGFDPVKVKVVLAVGIDRAIQFYDAEYPIRPYQLLERAVRGNYITLDEINERVVDSAMETAQDSEDMDEVGSSDFGAYLRDFLDEAGFKVGYVKGRLTREYADGGNLSEIRWQDVQKGDSARVKETNKMGVIFHGYGRKFNLRFIDGTEKTYDASELEFYKDREFADGGGVEERLVGTFYYDTRKDKTFRVISSDKDKVSIQYFDKSKNPIGKIEDVQRSEFEYLTNMGAWGKYKQSYFADGGMFEDNDGFMRADNNNNYRYPEMEVYVETLDEPIDLTSNVSSRSNKVVIKSLNENIDLNDDNRVRATMGYNPKNRNPENFSKINPRAFEFIDLPMPNSNTHKND